MKYAFKIIGEVFKPYRIEFPCFPMEKVQYEDRFIQPGERNPVTKMLSHIFMNCINKRILIPTDPQIISPANHVSFISLDWKTELRIRVSNALIYSNLEDIADALWANNLRLTQREVEELFDPSKELNLFRMLEVIRIFNLPFVVEEVKFKYK